MENLFENAIYLPRVFLRDDGQLNTELFDKVWSLQRNARGAKKSLARELLHATKHSSLQQAFEEIIYDRQNFAHWFDPKQCKDRSLFSLILVVMIAEDSDLKFETLEKKGFLEKRKELSDYYGFNLEKLTIFIDSIELYTGSHDFLALFIWMIIVESRVAARRFPNEPSFPLLEPQLLKALADRKLNLVLEKIEPVPFKRKQEERCKSSMDLLASPQGSEPKNALSEKRKARQMALKSLEDRCAVFNRELLLTGNKTATLQFDQNITETLGLLVNTAKFLQDDSVKLKQEYKDFCELIHEEIERKVGFLGFRPVLYSLEGKPAEWSAELDKRIDCLFELDCILEDKKDINSYSLAAAHCAEIEVVATDDLTLRVNDKLNDFLNRDEAQKVYLSFTKSIEANAVDLTWHAFEGQHLGTAPWVSIFKHLLYEEVSNPLIGISSYCAFSETHELLANFIRRKLSESEVALKDCLDILSCLNAAQIEYLSRNNPDLKITACLVLLEAFLSAVDVEEFAHAYNFWSIFPLSEVYNGNASPDIKSLFSALYSLGMHEENLLNYQSIKLAISNAKTVRGDSKEQELNRLRGQLSDVLQYRRKAGGVTYGQIWESAYESTLAPLLRIYLKSGMAEFFRAFEAWYDSFEIDKNIEGWKSEIPEHLKKDSVYDKFIRTQLQLKLGELKGLGEIYYSLTTPQKTHGDALSEIKESIKSILSSDDKDAPIIRSWLEIRASGASTPFNPFFSIGQALNPGREFYKLKKIDIRYPRMFTSDDFRRIDYSAIYTDLIIKSLSFDTPENLVNSYLNYGFVDGAQKLISEENLDLPPDLERLAEREFEEASAAVQQELEGLGCWLSLDADGALSPLLQQAKSLLDDGLLRKAQIALAEAAQIAEAIKEYQEECGSKAEILSKLVRLQDTEYDESKTAAELTSYYFAQLAKCESRRRHISVIKKLEAVPQPELSKLASECVDSLECYERFPDASTSEAIAFYWEQAVEPLLKELVRSKTLLPEYSEKLLKLGFLLCVTITRSDDSALESSNINQALIQTAEQWASLPDKGLEAANNIFESFKRFGVVSQEEGAANDGLIHVTPASTLKEKNTETLATLEASSALIEIAKKWQNNNHDTAPSSGRQEIVELISGKNWESVQNISHSRLLASEFEDVEQLENWTLSSSLANDDSIGLIGHACALRMVSAKPNSTVARYLTTDRSAKQTVDRLSLSFLMRMAGAVGWEGDQSDLSQHNVSSSIEYIFENSGEGVRLRQEFQTAYSVINWESIPLKTLWDKFSGDQRQAEVRAQIMTIAWRLGAQDALAYCLTLSPIDMDKRKSSALAAAAIQALASGNSYLLQPFLDLRAKNNARPFHLFVETLTRSIGESNELPAKLRLLGSLEKHTANNYLAEIEVIPRRVDSPDSITMRLPANAPIRFSGAATAFTLSGPFLSDTSVQVRFELIEPNAYSFDLPIACTALSITGHNTDFVQPLNFTVAGSQNFSPMTPEEIAEAFDHFPSAHMRGDDYVPRIVDEQKIERALFQSKTVRSLWITSPRRSGKTSMLYRIVDAYSHKEGRDNLVIFLTLDSSIESTSAFNRWLWKRIQSSRANEHLRALYPDFLSIGIDLPYDADVGTFIGELSDRLLYNWKQATRVIFLIDEVDRLASMYFQGGSERALSMDILWQIRHFISERRDIGIVFAGSSAAREVFINRAESPFYNSIEHLELSAFATKTKQQEQYSRLLVEPSRVRATYALPKETLEHIIWVCSGIPYYMKLISGATLSRARQSRLLISDVNEGVRALLSKETGISKLDDMGGDPGSDDLRTIVGLEQASDATLAKAVLYAFADIHSPMSGNRTFRGKISSSESKLINTYQMNRAMIEKGLDICLKLGLLKLITTESAPAVDFTIPLLGEAIRKASPRLWATIDHELTKLVAFGETP